MPQAVIDKLFNPFFTTKPVGKGTGIGMSISHQIVVERHQGKLECRSQLGAGTEFLIQIPIQQPSDAPTGEGKGSVSNSGATRVEPIAVPSPG
ncbi:HAMP domain-containing histidine kinase [Romeria aff. gracilis LEGE 07310]|uniref:histidine kinase n=2 Tax=Vasconcelosia TaxID=3366328 RepID=A0A8J7DBY2_9CYAN|nr:HAMP domain-containing histidine kinase [Romeria aff. gracilis LEGE 07310]